MTDPTVISQTPTTLPPVRQEVVVRVPVDVAFRAFTADFDRWWPRSHHIGASDPAAVVLEPCVDGRWYERAPDGTECDWGRVLAWDPPNRLVLAWGIDGEWTFTPELERSSRVEVVFTTLPDGATRVVLEHREFERHGLTAAGLRGQVDSGWQGLLALYAGFAQDVATRDAR